MPRALRNPLLAAGAGFAGLALVWLLAYQWVPSRTVDGFVYEHAQLRHYQPLVPFTNAFGHLLLVPMLLPLYALASGWALLTAWRRHGAPTAIAAAVVLLGANGVTQVLKTVTATERPWSTTWWGHVVSFESWPSGHATASAALAVALVLAAAPEHRPRVARFAGCWALLAGLAVVWLGWHMPSDTLGGWCVVALVSGVVVAGLRASGTVRAPRRGRRVAPAQSSV